ncbi:helix-turn-helix domain protein [Streptococcus pneumoniae]|nr:helix-turn-helix domain protein [Streptococcus pneumoniae]
MFHFKQKYNHLSYRQPNQPHMRLLNLSTLYLYNQDKNMCKQICYTLLEDAKNKKSYDRLAICYVRIGICRDNAKLIQKGFSLLELTEETSMLSHLKKEVETHYQPKKL